jgi:hypothetical protein
MSESIIAVCFFHSFAPFFAKATACKALLRYSPPDRTPACTERAGAGFGGQSIFSFAYLHICTLTHWLFIKQFLPMVSFNKSILFFCLALAF